METRTAIQKHLDVLFVEMPDYSQHKGSVTFLIRKIYLHSMFQNPDHLIVV